MEYKWFDDKIIATNNQLLYLHINIYSKQEAIKELQAARRSPCIKNILSISLLLAPRALKIPINFLFCDKTPNNTKDNNTLVKTMKNIEITKLVFPKPFKALSIFNKSLE